MTIYTIIRMTAFGFRRIALCSCYSLNNGICYGLFVKELWLYNSTYDSFRLFPQMWKPLAWQRKEAQVHNWLTTMLCIEVDVRSQATDWSCLHVCYRQSSRWALVLWPKTIKTLFGPVIISVFICNYIKILGMANRSEFTNRLLE
jgi:hypothetical protein